MELLDDDDDDLGFGSLDESQARSVLLDALASATPTSGAMMPGAEEVIAASSARAAVAAGLSPPVAAAPAGFASPAAEAGTQRSRKRGWEDVDDDVDMGGDARLRVRSAQGAAGPGAARAGVPRFLPCAPGTPLGHRLEAEAKARSGAQLIARAALAAHLRSKAEAAKCTAEAARLREAVRSAGRIISDQRAAMNRQAAELRERTGELSRLREEAAGLRCTIAALAEQGGDVAATMSSLSLGGPRTDDDDDDDSPAGGGSSSGWASVPRYGTAR